MSSLRERAVEAMSPCETHGYDDCGASYESAAECLDALLDFLDAHTEEWERLTIDTRGRYNTQQLVAALRGTTEEQ